MHALSALDSNINTPIQAFHYRNLDICNGKIRVVKLNQRDRPF